MRFGLNKKRMRNRKPQPFWVKNQNTLTYIVIFSCIITLLSMWIFNAKLTPILSRKAVEMANNLSNDVINDAVNKTMEKCNYSYSDLISISYSSENKPTTLVADTMKLNKLRSDLSAEIAKNINNVNKDIYIHLGSFLSNTDLTSGLGPKLKIKIVPITLSDINFKSDFTSEGINQTRHSIYIDINTEVGVKLPISDSKTVVSVKMLLIETLFFGDVPDSLTNFQGTEQDAKDGILNRT